GGVEVVPPQQADDAAAQPDAFRIAGRSGEQARRLRALVDALLAFFGGVGGRLLLFGRGDIAALGERHTTCQTEGNDAEHGTERTQRRGYRHCPAGFDESHPPTVRLVMKPDWDAIAAFASGRPGAVALNT